ncbi:MAG: zinc-dependent metalloprotease [Saprospiraceae bacterium]|nr:zinc-dependent metalloprotease [Saprospiraceae bacterium]
MQTTLSSSVLVSSTWQTKTPHAVSKIIVRTLIFVLFWAQVAQYSFAQEVCGTTGGPGSIGMLNIPSNSFTANNLTPVYLRVYVHAVGKDDGSGAPTLAQIRQSMEILREDFKERNIFFVQVCGVIPINNTALYNATYPAAPNCMLSQYSNHVDGIDIFIGGDNAPGHNAASGIPGKSFIVKGSLSGDGGPDNCPADLQWVSSRSHTISHEMGHCLGLWHTHHGVELDGVDCNGNVADPTVCEDLVANTNDDVSCGDYVSDTPPDPKLFACTPNIYEHCVYDLGETDSQQTPFDPDETLFMSYSHNKCMTKFSDGQADRMHTIIQTISPILQACIIPVDFTEVSINTTTTWTTSNTPHNGDIRIEGDLVVESGATFTVQSGVTLHFGPDNSLIIKPNAKLELYGTLSGRGCNGYTWKGVKVYGSSSTQSQFAVGGIYAQGRLKCRPGSMIINAETGIQLYGPSTEQTGGQVTSDGATIKNCATGVDINPYENFWPYPSPQQGQPRKYAASFFSTSFLTDDAYPFSLSPTMASLKGVNGVFFSGCEFSNTRTGIQSDANTSDKGIYAFDAGFDVIARGEGSTYPYTSYTSSTFTGLGYGIYTTRGSVNRPYTVRQAIFENCGVGIRNARVAGGTILFNTFLLGRIPYEYIPNIDPGDPGTTIETPKQFGIVFENDIAGFTCQENTFMNKYGSEDAPTIGTFCKNTGNSNKIIRRNTYQSLNYGNVVNESNASQVGDISRGLYFDCNVNQNVLEKDFFVSQGGEIKAKQGLEVSSQTGIVYNAAGNQFSYTNVDFSNFGSPLQYYFYLSGQKEEPLEIEGFINNISAEINICQENFCAPPCKTKQELSFIKGSFFEKRSALQAIIASQSPALTEAQLRSMAYYQRKMDEDAYTIVLHAMYDTTEFHADTLLYWIGHLGSLEGDLWLSEERARQGNYTAAQIILDEADSKYELDDEKSADLDNYKSIESLLEGKSVFHLDKSTRSDLEGFTGFKGFTQGRLENILTLYGAHFPVTCILEPAVEQRSKKYIGRKAKNWVSTYPNPARDVVQFLFTSPTDLEDVSLIITDMNARVIQCVSSLSVHDGYTWQSGACPSGMYFYRIIVNGVIEQSGKIVLDK